MDRTEILHMAAFLPQYRKDLGQGVEIFRRSGEKVWVPLSLRSFMKQITAAFAISIPEARHFYGQILGQKNLVPIVLSPFLLYVPIKIRKPMICGDPAYGYFRLRSVEAVCVCPEGLNLQLEGGHEIRVIQSKRTVYKRFRAARILEAFVLDHFRRVMDPGLPPAGEEAGDK